MIIGDINIPDAIINLQVQVDLLSGIIEKITQRTNVKITQAEVDQLRRDAQNRVIAQYPQSGIKFNNG